MDTTETVISGTGIGMATETGIGKETGTAETIGVVLPVTMVDAQETSTTTDVLTMKIDAVIIDVTMTTVTVEVVVKTLVRLIGVVAEQGEEMDLALPKGDPQHPMALFRCLNENEKHQVGMFMPPDMSSIQRCRRSKQVSFVHVDNMTHSHDLDTQGSSICQALIVPRSPQFSALPAFHPPFLYRHSAWESVVTPTSPGNLVDYTLAALHRT